MLSLAYEIKLQVESHILFRILYTIQIPSYSEDMENQNPSILWIITRYYIRAHEIPDLSLPHKEFWDIKHLVLLTADATI